jgi:glycosyltransferase involved in cell wall biosynthesis
VTTIDVVGPHLEDQGGVSTVNRNYRSAGLFEKGHDGLDVRYFTSTRDGAPLFRALYGALRFVRFALRPLDFPDVVHLHTSWGGSTVRKCVYAWTARLRGAKVVFHIHPSEFFNFVDRQRRWFRRRVYSTMSRADAIIVLTPEMKSLTTHRIENVPVQIISNPVNPFDFGPVAGVVRDSTHVAFLGRFAEEKGVLELLESARMLLDKDINVRLTLAGAKAEADINAAIARLKLQDVVSVKDWLGARDVAELLRRCTVFALPSHTEGIPMVLMEAMMCGAPIVTCPVGGVPLIVKDTRNGLLVPPGDVSALTQALERFLSSPELRDQISTNNISDSAQFHSESIVRDLRGLYGRLASTTGAS